MAINSLAEKALTEKELTILRKHLVFFKSLSDGSRAPSTSEQRHFVQTAQGKALPESEYELVWYRYQNLLEASQEYEKLKNNNNSQNQQIDYLLQANETLKATIEKWRESLRIAEEQLLSVTLSEAEANLIAKKLAASDDQESKEIATSLIKKIKKLHIPNPSPLLSSESLEKCNACGSTSPNLCRCSE